MLRKAPFSFELGSSLLLGGVSLLDRHGFFFRSVTRQIVMNRQGTESQRGQQPEPVAQMPFARRCKHVDRRFGTDREVRLHTLHRHGVVQGPQTVEDDQHRDNTEE